MLPPALEKHCFEASPSQRAAQWPLQIGSIQLSHGQGKGSLHASRNPPGTNTPHLPFQALSRVLSHRKGPCPQGMTVFLIYSCPSSSPQEENKHSPCKFALGYSVFCLEKPHFLLCLWLNICRFRPQRHSRGLLSAFGEVKEVSEHNTECGETGT